MGESLAGVGGAIDKNAVAKKLTSPHFTSARNLTPTACETIHDCAVVFCAQDRTAASMARISLRSQLDRDVYTVLKRFEENGGKPFKSVHVAYDAIQRSNSSVRRQKKRPLEDAIERVIQLRRQEADDSSDSEAELEIADPPIPEEDNRFLLNRQMVSRWHADDAAADTTKEKDERPQAKKRRIQSDADDAAGTGANGTASDAPSALSKQEKTQPKKPQKVNRFTVQDSHTEIPLGGLGEIYADISRIVWVALKYASQGGRGSWPQTTGLMLSGPAGMGKSSLMRNVASAIPVPLVMLSGCFEDPDKMEKSIVDAFDTAAAMAPSVVFIKDVELYMSKPSSSKHNEHHARAVRLLDHHMRRVRSREGPEGRVFALATTSNIADVDPAVLRQGLFSVTKQLKVPDYTARLEILQTATLPMELGSDVDLDEMARATHGFVAVELVQVIARATMLAQTQLNADPDKDTAMAAVEDDEFLNSSVGGNFSPQALPAMEHFRTIIEDFTPALRNEGFTDIPNVTWEQVGALEHARKQLQMSIIGPIQNPEQYRDFGLECTGGILLWGPPGCGKTLVAQAVAHEAKASFILINGPELLNKYVGESERAVRELFQRARTSAPCILFFDEIDSIAPPRANSSTESGARVVNALLTELDGAKDRTGVYVIGTTNRPEMIDEAILRPGRLGEKVLVDLPTPDERVDILLAIYRTKHKTPTPAALEGLAVVAQDKRCTNFSGADLSGLHSKAAMAAMERWTGDHASSKEITKADWEVALSTTTASVRNPNSYRDRTV